MENERSEPRTKAKVPMQRCTGAEPRWSLAHHLLVFVSFVTGNNAYTA